MWKHAPFFFHKRIEMKQSNLLLIVALLLCFCACHEKTKKSEEKDRNVVTERDMYLTAKDTTAVKTLVTMFMDLTKRNSLDSAVALLRTPIPEQEPQSLDINKYQEVVKTLGQFPVIDYEIEHAIFKKAEDNEVKCRVRIANGTYTNWYFKPVRYIGRWSLCLKDAGDKPLK